MHVSLYDPEGVSSFKIVHQFFHYLYVIIFKAYPPPGILCHYFLVFASGIYAQPGYPSSSLQKGTGIDTKACWFRLYKGKPPAVHYSAFNQTMSAVMRHINPAHIYPPPGCLLLSVYASKQLLFTKKKRAVIPAPYEKLPHAALNQLSGSGIMIRVIILPFLRSEDIFFLLR